MPWGPQVEGDNGHWTLIVVDLSASLNVFGEDKRVYLIVPKDRMIENVNERP